MPALSPCVVSTHLQTAVYCYDGWVVRIREAALGDGLGAKVWQVAHLLCLELAAQRTAIAHMARQASAAAGAAEAAEVGVAGAGNGVAEGQGSWPGEASVRVLELGSGCGVCGLAAAAMLRGGAGGDAVQVVMTDVEGAVLRNLRACMHMNADAAADAEAAAAASAAGQSQRQQTTSQQQQEPPALPTDEELFDGAEEVDFGADLLSGLMNGSGGGESAAGDDAGSSSGCGSGNRASGTAGASGPNAWERGNTSVRLLDWMESVRALDEGPEAAAAAAAEAAAKGGQDMPPRVALEERFPLIIGSEVGSGELGTGDWGLGTGEWTLLVRVMGTDGRAPRGTGAVEMVLGSAATPRRSSVAPI